MSILSMRNQVARSRETMNQILATVVEYDAAIARKDLQAAEDRLHLIRSLHRTYVQIVHGIFTDLPIEEASSV